MEHGIVMTDQLAGHVAAALAKMSSMGYSKHTQRVYGKVWEDLLEYAKLQQNQAFTSEYSKQFIEETYGVFFENTSVRSKTNRPMSVLLDFIRLGVIIRQKNGRTKGFTQEFEVLFSGFLESQSERGLSGGSIPAIRSRLFRLENFLLDSGKECFSDVTREEINRYIESFIGRASSTSSESLRELGRLCDYALAVGHHTESFSHMIPRVKNIRRQRLPHIFTADEVQKLMSAVDKNHPTGKRDYAMLLMTARLGLRAGDVRTLRLSAIDWTRKTVSLTQEKTGKFLELPLPDDIGWAIIDYLKNGRPICESEIVFISHQPPYIELNPTAGNIVAKYMRKAGIKTPQGRVSGMHTLRHSLASGMLAEGIPLPTISSVLGHADISSTEAYLRVDVNGLRKCALEVEL